MCGSQEPPIAHTLAVSAMGLPVLTVCKEEKGARENQGKEKQPGFRCNRRGQPSDSILATYGDSGLLSLGWP